MIPNSESNETKQTVTQNRIAVATFMDNGVLQTRSYNIESHADRVSISKLIIWATRNDIELRFRSIA